MAVSPTGYDHKERSPLIMQMFYYETAEGARHFGSDKTVACLYLLIALWQRQGASIRHVCLRIEDCAI
jgi:hypothetical protein